ncbi:SoxR reducing system RseC family protein [Aliikangiella sp. IMCC44653]
MTNPTDSLTETALVIKQQDNNVWVATQSKLACRSCKVSSSCGSGIIEQYFSGKVFETLLENRVNAQVGDLVEISIPKSSLTTASLLLYIVPLVGLIIGALVGHQLALAELSVILLSFLCMSTAMLISRFWSKKLLSRTEFQPLLKKIIQKARASTLEQSISISNRN